MTETLVQGHKSTAGESNKHLQQRWDILRQNQPDLRIRDAAEKLNVSELELLTLPSNAKNIVPLGTKWFELINSLEAAGPLVALSRNNFAVHEKAGSYAGLRGSENMGIIIQESIDLRLFFQQWKSGYSVKSDTCQDSLQFFGNDGAALHKIYCTEKTDKRAWQRTVLKYAEAGVTHPEVVRKEPVEQKPALLGASKLNSFLSRWAELTNVHQFFNLLRDFNLTRIQAMELAQKEWTYSVPIGTVPRFIRSLAGTQIPLMVFVPNDGIVQIHTGSIERCVQTEHWFNILDPEFSLHLNTAGIDRAWVVRKPTSDGIISSLEIYDIDGELVMQMFGARQEGTAELAEWRDKLCLAFSEVPKITD